MRRAPPDVGVPVASPRSATLPRAGPPRPARPIRRPSRVNHRARCPARRAGRRRPLASSPCPVPPRARSGTVARLLTGSSCSSRSPSPTGFRAAPSGRPPAPGALAGPTAALFAPDPFARGEPTAHHCPGAGHASLPGRRRSLRAIRSGPRRSTPATGHGETRQCSTHRVVGAKWPVGWTPSSQRGQMCASARKKSGSAGSSSA